MTEENTAQEPQPERLVLGTYFVVGITEDGEPALFLSPEVEDMVRVRQPTLAEVRRVLDAVTSELHLRFVRSTVMDAVSHILDSRKEPTVAERVGAAMAARQEEPV